MSTGASPDASAALRCFIALLPDAASRQALHRCRESLGRTVVGPARGVRWIEPAALHLTLRFLGASGHAQIEYLKHMLPALAPALSPIASHRYGIWPNRARPRLLVLELEADAALSKLAGDCELHACKAGFAPEPRGFRAHITLARLRPGCAFGTLPRPSMPVVFDAVALMRSTLSQPAASYTELARASTA